MRRKDAALVFNTKIRCAALAAKIFRNDSYFLRQFTSIRTSIKVNLFVFGFVSDE